MFECKDLEYIIDAFYRSLRLFHQYKFLYPGLFLQHFKPVRLHVSEGCISIATVTRKEGLSGHVLPLFSSYTKFLGLLLLLFNIKKKIAFICKLWAKFLCIVTESKNKTKQKKTIIYWWCFVKFSTHSVLNSERQYLFQNIQNT